MSYTNISKQIIEVLKTVNGLNAVYEHNEKNSEKFPYAIVLPESHDDTFNDTSSNVRSFTFNIFIIATTTDAQDSERIMRVLVDDVISKLEGNVKLNNSCDYSMPSSGRWGYSVDRNPPIRYCNITLTARKRVVR